MNGIGDAANETPDFGVCTNVADVGVNSLTFGVCAGLVANNDCLGAVAIVGVAVRPPAS